ncbi:MULTISPECIES: GntP family permease [Anaerotruncus]|uniref:GntP family permease n=1 Tax=Anaerotruncus TaxID=244127 RepID=UPI00207E0289|nr:gluconate:H+ symporter [Anaerotruncus massiliensis (ex Togo et al. 2019)]GKH48430.1 gluconate permease [Oscillospiraceae bacterium]
MNTLIVFLVSMVFLLVVLIRFKWSASVGLVSATIMMGLLSGMKIADLTGAISGGFGSTMTSTGLVIIFGCIFGEMLGSSGALEEIAKFLLRKVGSKHDYLAINLLGYVVSIPVYFGSAYVMLSPLLNSLQKLTNKKMTGYVNALFVGLLLTHCIVAPTPGPVAVAAEVGANLGWFIFYGLIVSIIASLLCGWQFSNGINARGRKEAQEFLDANSDLIKADETKPSAGIGFALILFPIILIVLGAVVPMFVAEGSILYTVFQFIGDKNVALFMAMLLAAVTLRKYLVAGPAKKGIMRYIDTSANKVGSILMVIGCGGCFAKVITQTGIGDALANMFSHFNMPVLLLGFLLAMIIRAAVGSATVAMMTAVSIVGPAIALQGLSPVLVGLAVCAGTVGLTLPTDGAFWHPSQLNGISINETMVVTVSTTLASVVAFAIILLINCFSGFLPGLF